MIRPKSPRGFSLWRRAGLFFGANMGNKESSQGDGGGECPQEHQGAATMSGAMNNVKQNLKRGKDKQNKNKKGKGGKPNSFSGDTDLPTTTADTNSGFMVVGSQMGQEPMTSSPLQPSGSIKPGRL